MYDLLIAVIVKDLSREGSEKVPSDVESEESEPLKSAYEEHVIVSVALCIS